jgi:hypothetical protein
MESGRSGDAMAVFPPRRAALRKPDRRHASSGGDPGFVSKSLALCWNDKKERCGEGQRIRSESFPCVVVIDLFNALTDDWA